MPNTLLATQLQSTLQSFNSSFSQGWNFGMNWSNVNHDLFETYINKYLFPKISETRAINTDLGNSFDFMAKEMEYISQFSEEYVILDAIPTNMDLSRSEELMLKRNYPKMATRLYGAGELKKLKFTLNNNDVRFNFLTLKDAVTYALSVYKKRISDINVDEERQIKGTIIDYALHFAKDNRTVSSLNDLGSEIFHALLNIQNNSEKYNEADMASGGLLGRYTTFSSLKDMVIITNDRVKTYLLDTKIANTFNEKGIDFTNRIISFDDLGGTYQVTEDIEIVNTETLDYIVAMGNYQARIGDIIPEGSVMTYDITELEEFEGKFEEIKPETELFAYIFDERKLRYRRYTKDMLKQPFNNPEFDEVTYWLHYYSSKNMSPFYNSVVVQGG